MYKLLQNLQRLVPAPPPGNNSKDDGGGNTSSATPENTVLHKSEAGAATFKSLEAEEATIEEGDLMGHETPREGEEEDGDDRSGVAIGAGNNGKGIMLSWLVPNLKFVRLAQSFGPKFLELVKEPGLSRELKACPCPRIPARTHQ